MTTTATIIGAGISGLTTALTLKKNGLNVNIYEGSSEIKPVGAGIILANNAMQVFQKMGIQDKIEKTGNKISTVKITDAQLNRISDIDLTEFEKQYGVYNVAIHRGKLQKILANEVGYENIKLSKRLSKIDKNRMFTLTFEDKTTLESSVVIGADGLNSTVRNQLFAASTLRNAKQTCWRGVCDIELPEKYHNELNEAWGKGKRFGFVKISDKKVYWYALTNLKKARENSEDLTDIFSEFHNDILHIISKTAINQIMVTDIIDLKPMDKWQSDNICLVGDAAHATTPNLGQGACQAIEDAYIIGQLLDSGMALKDTFIEYEKIRRKKAHMIVNTSWSVGKIAQIENQFGILARNFIMKNIPKPINKTKMYAIFKL
ncbi:FAD-dependent monooxygenase [Ostreibacterium oceani]|uniref:NAD(P)-binding protein n=1 Tax=Ostreibacterium oceani TaxID=2654998 RepID=A0A6N7F247_9GAMM|nr:FAD-dependent monooxygenase [Ostreibacterium oceani]MPV86868.1 NAD(P)-binding protein [Ostreibacterium oceani]